MRRRIISSLSFAAHRDDKLSTLSVVRRFGRAWQHAECVVAVLCGCALRRRIIASMRFAAHRNDKLIALGVVRHYGSDWMHMECVAAVLSVQQLEHAAAPKTASHVASTAGDCRLL